MDEPAKTNTPIPTPKPNSVPANDSPFASGDTAVVAPAAIATPATEAEAPPKPPKTPEPSVMEKPVTNKPVATEQVQVVGEETKPTGGGGNRKKIMGVLGVLVLLGGLGTGMILVRQRQQISKKAEEPLNDNVSVAGEIESLRCINIAAYNNQWVELTAADLSNLKSGETVRFVVRGSATSGSFDKARFSINSSVVNEETAQTDPGGDYYYEYIIPDNETTFTIDAQLHHVETDQWI